ncbi:MAG: hypothetical protein P4L45_09650 [Ignavibacteriaceae bacterium]|nr:hypothetical protein [Ignavibacteriaceae bacterium]
MNKNQFNNPLFAIFLAFIFVIIISQFLNGVNIDKVAEVESNNSGTTFYQDTTGLINVPLSGNLSQMKYFFDALKHSGNSQVRIAHYGDSGLLGDMYSSKIREDLQKQFGGNTVGFIPIVSDDIYMRSTIKQSFSNDWETISVLTANPHNLPIGISGFVSIPKGLSWVRYATTVWHPYLKNFSTVILFYSNAKYSSIKYSFNDSTEQSINLNPGSNVQELILSTPHGNASSIKITTTQIDQACFYGVSLESGNGVYVDNYPWKGNTGLGIRSLPKSSLIQFNKLLNYKLIILSFGAVEALAFHSKDDSWFERQAINIIVRLKSLFPETSILINGVSDHSIKVGTKYVTNPRVPEMNNILFEVAAKTGITYWDTFNAMGGYNSMAKWVNANPPLGAFNYGHLSELGAEQIGDMLAKALIDAYRSYN